ncbi:MAG: FadR family transcriptional regulator [Firmicutes bacterium]|nr:FadR family transcriptional regulator [Bacillota bacterium]
MAIKPAVRTTLYKEVMNQLVDLVKREEWVAGDKIPGELELARTFQVSRNCIREALKSLAHVGVLESKPGLGTFLSQDAKRNIHTMELGNFMRDDNSLRELMEVRLMIEPQLVQVVAERATEQELEELRMTVERTVKAVHDNQYSMQVGLAFHMGLVHITKNRILTRIFNSISEELTVQRGLLLLSHPDAHYLLQELQEHEDIYNCLKNRDGAKAREIMELHLRKAVDILTKAQIRRSE